MNSSAMALNDERLNRELLRLDPETRLEQTCDTEVMFQINRNQPRFEADKVIAYTFGDPTFGENSIAAPGGVFRSRGNWYHISYNCMTGPKHLDAHSLHYEIGPEIPKSLWTKYSLYN
ncbi:hypothetical protein CWB41_04750 [Methylovirgula ligni]|nr:hypothetical protein CWB41_04750 [Methylovirgula ligni]